MTSSRSSTRTTPRPTTRRAWWPKAQGREGGREGGRGGGGGGMMLYIYRILCPGWKKNLGKLIEFAKDEGRRGGREGGRGYRPRVLPGLVLDFYSQRGERKRRRLRAW